MKELMLSNGTTAPEALVTTVTMLLEEMLEEGASGGLELYELHQKCLNPSHEIFSEAQAVSLKDKYLMRADGTIDEPVKNIVLSSVKGEGLGIELANPLG